METRLVACLCTSLSENEPVSVIDVLKRAKVITRAFGIRDKTVTVKILLILYHGHSDVLSDDIHQALGLLVTGALLPQILNEIKINNSGCC